MTPAPVDFTTVYTRNRLYCAIVLIFLLKSTTTTLFRGIYPFAEYFASDMGIPVGRFFLVLSIGELLGAAAPLLSPLSERLGSRKVLVVTGAANAVFSVLIGLGLSSLGLFVVAWCLYSLVKTLFFGAAGAFIGSFVPPNLQTRATGFVEFSWGFASFVGLTFIGFIVSVAPYGWMMHTTGIAMGIIAVLLYVTFFSKATRQPSPSSLCDNADTRMIDDRPVIGIELSAGYTTNHLSTRTDGDTVTNASRSPQHSAAVLQPSDATVADEPPAKPLLSGLAQFKIVFSDIGAVCLLVSGVMCIVCASITFTNYGAHVAR
jgi:MFS family permease